MVRFLKNLKGGVREAARMLSGLPLENRKRVIELISDKDPVMASELEKNMITMEDLQYLTVKMIQELLREFDIKDFALCLRVASDAVKTHILSNVSKTMKEDILEVLAGPPQPALIVDDKLTKLMALLKLKAERGEIIINPRGQEEYV